MSSRLIVSDYEKLKSTTKELSAKSIYIQVYDDEGEPIMYKRMCDIYSLVMRTHSLQTKKPFYNRSHNHSFVLDIWRKKEEDLKLLRTRLNPNQCKDVGFPIQKI